MPIMILAHSRHNKYHILPRTEDLFRKESPVAETRHFRVSWDKAHTKGDRSPASMWYPFWQAGLPPRSDVWSMGRALTTASAVSLSYEMDQSSVAFRGSQVGLHCIGQVLNWITEIGNDYKCFRKTNTIKPLRSALWKAFCLGHLV